MELVWLFKGVSEHVYVFSWFNVISLNIRILAQLLGEVGRVKVEREREREADIVLS